MFIDTRSVLHYLNAPCLRWSVLIWWVFRGFSPNLRSSFSAHTSVQRGGCFSSFGADMELPDICYSSTKSLQPLGGEAHRASLSFTVTRGLLKLTSIELVMARCRVHVLCVFTDVATLPTEIGWTAGLVYILTKTIWEYFFSSHPCQNFIFANTEIFCCSDYCSVLKLIVANADCWLRSRHCPKNFTCMYWLI